MGWQLAGISQLSTTRYRSVVTVKRPGSFKFSRAGHGSGIVAVVIAAIYRLRPSSSPDLAVVGGLHFRKVSYVTGARERGEAVCDAAGTTSLPLEIRESFLSWPEFTSLRGYSFFFFFFSFFRNIERSCVVSGIFNKIDDTINNACN